MNRCARVLALCLAAAAPLSGHAKDKIAFDPAGSYVLVEIENLKDAGVKGQSGPGSLILAPYDSGLGDLRGAAPKTPASSGKQPLRVTISNKPIVKTKEARLYLVPVPADTWVIEGSANTSFSLGSWSFSVGQGQVVDLGRFQPSIDWLEGEGARSMGDVILSAMLFGGGRSKDMRPVKLEWRPRGATDIPLPPELSALPLVAADYRDGAKFGNYLGQLVNRIGGRAARTAPAPTPALAPAPDPAPAPAPAPGPAPESKAEPVAVTP